MSQATNEVDLTTLSDEDLLTEWSAVGEQVTVLRERLTAFSHEHQRRTAQKALASQLGDSMSQEQADSLRQYLDTVQIDSGESVGADEVPTTDEEGAEV